MVRKKNNKMLNIVLLIVWCWQSKANNKRHKEGKEVFKSCLANKGKCKYH